MAGIGVKLNKIYNKNNMFHPLYHNLTECKRLCKNLLFFSW